MTTDNQARVSFSGRDNSCAVYLASFEGSGECHRPWVECSLRVADLDASVEFYSKLFNTAPAKRRPGYANFAVVEPPLKLVLLEGQPGEDTRMDHLGVEVETTENVTEAHHRLAEAGLFTLPEDNTTCCYAVQDKVWVTGPGQEPWKVYTVKSDARPDLEGKTTDTTQASVDNACCVTDDQDGTNVTTAAQPATM